MRKILMTMSLAGALILSACSSDKADPDIVVESEAGNVTKDEFYEELKNRNGEAILQEMLLKIVLEDTYSIDEKELNEQIDEIKEQFGDNFEMWLLQEGYGDEETLRDVMTVSLLYDQAIYDGIEISDEEVEAAYERMKEEIEARHVLVMDEETANEVKEKLDEGEDFADIAEEYSTDPGSAEESGNLGYFTALEMVPEFEDTAYSLKVDEISEPIKSDHGYHIIQVTDRRDAEEELAPLDEMEEEILSKLKNQKLTEEEARDKIDKLMKDAKIDIKIEEFKHLFDFSTDE